MKSKLFENGKPETVDDSLNRVKKDALISKFKTSVLNEEGNGCKMKRLNDMKPILYIKPGCPWCRAARSYFEQHGVDLDVRDVIKSRKDMDRMIEISGQSLTPTFEYGEFVVADFSVDELKNELEEFPEVRRQLGIDDEA